MEKYVYEAGEYYDSLYDLRMFIEVLKDKLVNNKRLLKEDRLALLDALDIIDKLKKDK